MCECLVHTTLLPSTHLSWPHLLILTRCKPKNVFLLKFRLNYFHMHNIPLHNCTYATSCTIPTRTHTQRKTSVHERSSLILIFFFVFKVFIARLYIFSICFCAKMSIRWVKVSENQRGCNVSNIGYKYSQRRQRIYSILMRKKCMVLILRYIFN